MPILVLADTHLTSHRSGDIDELLGHELEAALAVRAAARGCGEQRCRSRVVVFGHSHLPWNETIDLDDHVQHHFNPGSPTQRRRAPHATVGWIDVGNDGAITCRHQVVDASR